MTEMMIGIVRTTRRTSSESTQLRNPCSSLPSLPFYDPDDADGSSRCVHRNGHGVYQI